MKQSIIRNPNPKTYRHREFLVCFIIVITSFTFLVKTLDEPGLTWDEANFIPSSISYLNWFQILGDDIPNAFSKETITSCWYPTSEHPPFAKLLSALTISLFHKYTDVVFAARISTALIFSLLVLLVYKFTGAVYGRHAGYFAALSLFIMPRVFGHAHFASLDICMSFTWFFTVFSFTKGLKNIKWSIITGIVYGLALATKLNALFLPIPILIWAHTYHRKKYFPNVIAMLLISPLVFISIWPWLWPEPFTRIAHYITSKFDRISIPVYYLRTVYKDITAPWHYPIVMTLVTLPPLVLILAVSETVKIVKARFRKNPAGILILLNIVTCIGVMILPRAQKYDGVRLFLPAFPFIACLAGAALYRSLQNVKGKPSPVLGIILLMAGAIPLFNIHPYYLSYYNILTGGVKGANKLGFETTYWGDTCTNDILNYLNENAPPDAKIAIYPSGCNVTALYQFTGKLRKDIKSVPLEEWDTLDYLVLNCRQGFFDERLWEIYGKGNYECAAIFRDVPLTAVYKTQ